MTAQEAYKKMKRKHPLSVITGCFEFDSFYLFFMTPLELFGKNDYHTGTTFPAVDKRDGKIFEYDITSDVDAYENAKEVKLKSVFDRKVR